MMKNNVFNALNIVINVLKINVLYAEMDFTLIKIKTINAKNVKSKIVNIANQKMNVYFAKKVII